MTKRPSRQSDFVPPEEIRGPDPAPFGKSLEGGITNDPGDRGPTEGVGLPEIVSLDELEDFDRDEEENERRNPSDLNDEGDPEAGDDGVAGGLEAGGDESLGGTGGESRETGEWDGLGDDELGFEHAPPGDPLDEEVDEFLGTGTEED